VVRKNVVAILRYSFDAHCCHMGTAIKRHTEVSRRL